MSAVAPRRGCPGNGLPGHRVGPDVQRWSNGLKTAVLLGLMGGLILAAGALVGGRGGLLLALVIALALNLLTTMIKLLVMQDH